MCVANETATGYEKRQIELIKAWKEREPGSFSRAFEAANRLADKTKPIVKPVVMLLSPVVTPFKNSAVWLIDRLPIRRVIRIAGNLNRWLACQWASERSLLKRVGVHNFDELRALSLETLDREARRVRKIAIGCGAINGGAGGAGNVIIGVASVASAINIATRTVRQVGLCYGYDADDELEHHFIVRVLNVASATSETEKAAAFATLKEITLLLKRKGWKRLAKGEPLGIALVGLRELSRGSASN